MRGYSATALVAVMFAAGGATAGAAEPGAPYTLDVVALTGPQGGQLSVALAAKDGSAVPRSFEHVHVKLSRPGAEETEVVNLDAVSAPGGMATIELDPLERATEVDVQAQVRDDSPPRIIVLRDATTALLRPDVVVAAVHAPPQTLTTEPIDVVADLSELNEDTGAAAKVSLLLGRTQVTEPKTVTVPKGGHLSVTFEGVRLTTALSAELTVVVDGADPFETDETNNSRARTVEVTEHELRSNVLVPSLGGYGAQFNQHVYAAVTPKPPGSLPDLEAKVIDLEPQLVRIFFHEVQERNADQLASFYETVELAQQSGAAINITYHTAANARFNPGLFMRDFAIVLENLVTTRQLTNVRWVTIQNEPNATNVTQEQYEALYRALHAELLARGLRDQIQLMGGDLVRDGQRAWFQYIAAHMSDILDAYSVHIYWNYWDTPFFLETRLKDVRKIVFEELPVEARKPIYVTEFGVRGIQSIPGLPVAQPGYWQDGTPLSRTNIAAFQHLWFDLAAAQLGFSGTVKWDAYWGRYTTGYREVYNLIGPAEEGWPLFPAYHALRLLFQTTQRGWRVVELGPWEENDWKLGVPDQAEKELAAYASDDGELTLIGLDSRGRALNATSEEVPEYSIGELPALTEFNLAIWNATGNGETIDAGTVTTNAAGVARFAVPLHAAFALTTVPVS